MKNLGVIFKKVFHIPEKTPEYAQISFTNACNLSCEMCIRNYIPLDRRHMEWNHFTQIVDKLVGVKQISLAGLGESLTHPKIFDAIRYCKERGFKVQLTTNAFLLTEEKMKKLIESGIDTMSFSMESISDNYSYGHENAVVARNIERFLQMKKEMGKENPKVVIQPIMFKDKINDLYEVIRWAAEKGAYRVNVIRVDLRFVQDMPRPDVEEEKQIFKEFAKLRKELNFRIDCLQDQIFDGVTGFLYKHFKKLLRLDSYCYRFQDFIYINVNGNVHPCCLSDDQIMGNLIDQDIYSVWRNEKFDKLRCNMDDDAFCQKCDFLRLKQVV